jgi:hypothetical protein
MKAKKISQSTVFAFGFVPYFKHPDNAYRIVNKVIMVGNWINRFSK